jgi:hypothetical protein
MNRFVSVSDKEAEMNVPYYVELSQAERGELTALLSGGKQAARKLKRAQILLAADAGSSDEEIARTVASAVPPCTGPSGASWKVIWNGRSARSSAPVRSAGSRAKRRPCWWQPPARVLLEGGARWTLELLADAMVKLTEHESLSHETVRRRLAENSLKPWRRDMWCIPHVDAEYVARMEPTDRGYWVAYFAAVGIVWAIANTVLVGIPLLLKTFGEAGAMPLFLLLAVHLPLVATAATLLIEGETERRYGAHFGA